MVLIIQTYFYGCTSTTSTQKKLIASSEKQLPIKSSFEIEFVFINGGCFEMGCDPSAFNCPEDSQPKHRVCVDSFWMGQNEVTNEQFQFFKSENYSKNESGKRIMDLETEGENTNRFLRTYSKSEIQRILHNHPVTNVSWHGAKMMADWLSEKSGFKVRLPTEAEWEFACCSGTKKFQYGTKNGELSTNTIANYAYENGFYHSVKSVPVGNYPSNNFGLHDLSGNVSEWCEDWYKKTFYTELIEKSPLQIDETDHKVIRGGSYTSVIDGIRCYTRNKQWPDLKTSDVGFRFVIEPTTEVSLNEIPNLSLLKLVLIKDCGIQESY